VDDDPSRLVGADEVERQGFQQLFLLPVTWSGVWTAWPAEHHRELAETREAFWWPRQTRASGPVCHLIRSPWGSVSLNDLLAVMRVRVVRYRDWETNEQRAVQVARDVLSWGEARVAQEVAALRPNGRDGG
jgi:hypothetical protein